MGGTSWSRGYTTVGEADLCIGVRHVCCESSAVLGKHLLRSLFKRGWLLRCRLSCASARPAVLPLRHAPGTPEVYTRESGLRCSHMLRLQWRAPVGPCCAPC